MYACDHAPVRRFTLLLSALLFVASAGAVGTVEPAEAACSEVPPGGSCCDSFPVTNPADPCYNDPLNHPPNPGPSALSTWVIPGLVIVLLAGNLVWLVRRLVRRSRVLEPG